MGMSISRCESRLSFRTWLSLLWCLWYRIVETTTILTYSLEARAETDIRIHLCYTLYATTYPRYQRNQLITPMPLERTKSPIIPNTNAHLPHPHPSTHASPLIHPPYPSPHPPLRDHPHAHPYPHPQHQPQNQIQTPPHPQIYQPPKQS